MVLELISSKWILLDELDLILQILALEIVVKWILIYMISHNIVIGLLFVIMIDIDRMTGDIEIILQDSRL